MQIHGKICLISFSDLSAVIILLEADITWSQAKEGRGEDAP